MTIPTCWFNITSLDAFRLSQMRGANPDAKMHSVLLARAFLDGMGPDQAVAHYEEADLFSDAVLNGNLRETERSLRLRDENLDFSITDFVMGSFRRQRLFHSYNHPALEVLLEVCSKLSEQLDFPFAKKLPRYAAFDRLINPQWNINPKIYRHYVLMHQGKSGFVLAGQRLTLLEFAQREYALFARLEQKALTEDVERKEKN